MLTTALCSTTTQARGPSRDARLRASGGFVSGRRGFTLIELLLTMTLLALLATIAAQRFSGVRKQVQITRAIAEIRTLSAEIAEYEMIYGTLPATFADTGRAGLMDPWGNPYVYLNFGGTIQRNSMGQDAQSRSPLMVRVSHDDIIRANDGGYIGLAVNY